MGHIIASNIGGYSINNGMNTVNNLKPEELFSYQRQSVSKGSDGNRTKTMRDQRLENTDSAKTYLGMDLLEANMLDEDRNHGADEYPSNSGMEAMIGGEQTRRVLGIIIDKIKSGKCKALVIWSTCRLWRRVSLCEFLVDIMAKHGVTLVDRNGTLDLTTPDGRNRLFAAATSAMHMREMAVVNSPRGVRRSRDRGLAVASCDVLGFRSLGRGRVKVIPDEIELVKRIFREFCSGKNRTQIAKGLMADGIILMPDLQGKRAVKRTEQTSHLIHNKSVTSILTDVRYIGQIPHEKQVWDCAELLIDGEPAIEPALFYKAQALLNGSRRTSNNYSPDNYLAGLFRCSYCGQYLSVNPQKQSDGTTKKFWTNKKSDVQCWCTHSLPSISEGSMRSYTEDVLMPLLQSEAIAIIKARDQNAIANQIAILEKKIEAEVTEFKARVKEIFGNRSLTGMGSAMEVLQDEHDLKLSEMSSTLTALRAQHERDKAETQNALAAISEWDRLNHDQRRIAIHHVLRWVALIASEDFLTRLSRRGIRDYERERAGAPPAGKVVFLTAWGTIHTAIVERVRIADRSPRHKSLGLITANPSQCVGSAADLPDGGVGFASGLRRSYDCKGYFYKPEDVLPGFGHQNDPPVIKIDN